MQTTLSGHANLLKREGFTWFESMWWWVQTPRISRPKCRKSWLPKKKASFMVQGIADLSFKLTTQIPPQKEHNNWNFMDKKNIIIFMEIVFSRVIIASM